MCAGDDQEPELFFDEQEILAGAGSEQRAAMLQHFDNLLTEPGGDQVDQVGARLHRCILQSPSVHAAHAASWARPPGAPQGMQLVVLHCLPL